MKKEGVPTQKEIAKKLGITRIYLNYILNKKMRPGIVLAEKISKELNIPFFELRPDIKELYKEHM
jgi:transcriptional regulator with XRE-family HTH domain